MIQYSFLASDTSVSEKDVAVINFLLSVLDPTSRKVTRDMVSQASRTSNIILARDEDKTGQIVGMGSLVISSTLTRKMGHIEELVVNPEYQGKGIGRHILDELVKYAKANGLSQLDLTSRPSRQAANELYQRYGFKKRNTNPYRLELI